MQRAEHLTQCSTYCSTYCVCRDEDWLKTSFLLEAFEARAVRQAITCAKHISKAPNPEESFSQLSTNLVEAAVSHCQLFVVSKFTDKIQGVCGMGVKEQLQVFCGIYGLSCFISIWTPFR